MVRLIGIPRPVNYFCPPASHAYTRTNPPLPRHPLLKGPMNTLRSRRQTLEASWNFNTAGFLSESDSKCYLNMSIAYACACTQRCSVSARTFPANVSAISSKNLNQASDEKRDLAGQCFPPPLFLTPLFKVLVLEDVGSSPADSAVKLRAAVFTTLCWRLHSTAVVPPLYQTVIQLLLNVQCSCKKNKK